MVVIKLKREGHKRYPVYSVVILKKKIGIYKQIEDKVGNFFPIGEEKKGYLFINRTKLKMWSLKGCTLLKKIKKYIL